MRKKKTTAKGNRTVATGISLIKTIASLNGPATLTEIAKASRMLPMRTQRYLQAIVQTGLVAYNADTGRYDLGPDIIDLGLTAIGRLDSVRLGSEAIARLTRQTGLISLLNVWGSSGSTVVKYEQGKYSSLLRVREGVNLPLLTSATGLIFLTYMPQADIDTFLKRELAAWSNTQGQKPSAATIESLKAEVRKAGFARSSGRTGHDAIAAPVFDHNNNLCLVITVLSPAGTSDMSYSGTLARKLKETVDELSRRLGSNLTAARIASGR